MQILSLAYGIVCTNKRVTCITNEVLTSRHDCVFERYTCDLDLPKKLAGRTLYKRYCSMYLKKTCPFYILYCTNKSHRLFREAKCHCKLCVKDRPASLKSVCALISYKVYSPPNQTVSVRTNCVFKNLRVFNHTASKLLSATEPHSVN